MAPTSDRASQRSEDRQHDADDEQDDSDGPENRDLEYESGNQKDDSKDDHDGYLVSNVDEPGYQVSAGRRRELTDPQRAVPSFCVMAVHDDSFTSDDVQWGLDDVQWGLSEGKVEMIEVLTDMPEGVAGICVSGRLKGQDLREFKPVMAELMRADEIRLVEVISNDYEGIAPGGLVEDLKLGFGAIFQHHSKFKRIAVVSDKEWVTHTLHALAWMVPGELSMFGLDDLDRAKEWAAG